ncbi:hypothetical protein [Nocardia sp. NBC_00416]|uniref:hypothetical protein n=1 Tax=Nocardia sp. NBC_00416 TaxID=2975991 RepID=UPI002E1D874F
MPMFRRGFPAISVATGPGGVPGSGEGQAIFFAAAVENALHRALETDKKIGDGFAAFG